MTYFVTNFYCEGEEGELFLRKNGDALMVAASPTSTTFSKEGTEKLISQWSDEQDLFDCHHNLP